MKGRDTERRETDRQTDTQTDRQRPTECACSASLMLS